MPTKKTLGMKLLEGKRVPYEALSYPDDLRDAVEVAGALNLPVEQVYKTLVVSRTQPGKQLLVMVPSNRQLDLKKLAKSIGEKKVKMTSQKEAEKSTGLQVGGISALALLNRGFQIILDSSAQSLSKIVVSAGERGQQIRLSVPDLVTVSGARYADVVGAE